MALHPLTMPKIGLTMEEGTVAKWHVPEGGRVEAGQPIADIEIEKSTNELEAPVSGTLVRHVAAEGGVAPVAALIGIIADSDEDAAKADSFAASYVPLA